jgi:hypothetical protein
MIENDGDDGEGLTVERIIECHWMCDIIMLRLCDH